MEERFEGFESEHVVHEMPDVHEDPQEKESGEYQQYQELGGSINEEDYERVLREARNVVESNKTSMLQVEGIAKFVGIELKNEVGIIDERVILYGILRADIRLKSIEHHHAQMSDQQLFAEVLRMVGDVDSLHKLTSSHPNISF